MAASCLGAFGSYKLQYSRYLKDRETQARQQAGPPETETVWVTKRYGPNDERVIAPVPRHKHVVPTRAGNLHSGENHWIPVTDPPLSSFNRSSGYPLNVIYVSHPATRSEEWSTLRQMLPSYGNVWRVDQPNWGTTFGPPPTPLPKITDRHAHVNSSMTKFVDDMHKTHRQFRHC